MGKEESWIKKESVIEEENWQKWKKIESSEVIEKIERKVTYYKA